MNRRLNVRGEVKVFEDRSRSESESEQGEESRVHYNPKPSDLPMVRLKRG